MPGREQQDDFARALGGPNVGGSGVSPSRPQNPITQAANVQVDALQNAMPFFQPFLDAGNFGLDLFQQGSSAGGLEQILNEIMGGQSFQGLRDERQRGVQGQLSAGGLTRSGTGIEAAANIPTDLAFNISNLLSGRQESLAGFGFGGASNIADLTTRVGEAIASGILGNEERRSSRRSESRTNTSNLIGSVLGGAFSDPALKQNIEKIGEIGPLDLVQWDWIPEVEGTIVAGMRTMGFLSTQVREHYPEFVSEFGGYDLINFHGLIERLQCPS